MNVILKSITLVIVTFCHQSSGLITLRTNINKYPTQVFGILDDVMAESESSSKSNSMIVDTQEDNNHELEDLFFTLIFSSDIKKDVALRVDAVSQPAFMEFLEKRKESTLDVDEEQGLQDLLQLIENVKSSVDHERQQEVQNQRLIKEKEETDKENTPSETRLERKELMSNADILKQANAIDQAVVASAVNDDEKPSNFINDCREVVNLSRGFNDSGNVICCNKLRMNINLFSTLTTVYLGFFDTLLYSRSNESWWKMSFRFLNNITRMSSY